MQHYPFAMTVRKKQYFSVVAVQVGDKVKELHVLHHWGVDVPSREEVDRAHALAEQHKERYGISKIMPSPTSTAPIGDIEGASSLARAGAGSSDRQTTF